MLVCPTIHMWLTFVPGWTYVLIEQSWVGWMAFQVHAVDHKLVHQARRYWNGPCPDVLGGAHSLQHLGLSQGLGRLAWCTNLIVMDQTYKAARSWLTWLQLVDKAMGFSLMLSTLVETGLPNPEKALGADRHSLRSGQHVWLDHPVLPGLVSVKDWVLQTEWLIGVPLDDWMSLEDWPATPKGQQQQEWSDYINPVTGKADGHLTGSDCGECQGLWEVVWKRRIEAARSMWCLETWWRYSTIQR